MIHFCIFGGHEGELSPEKRVYICIFGGSELRLPTIARQVVDQHRRVQGVERSPSQCFFLTVFGGTTLKAPTLVEEYVDLLNAQRSGAIPPREWDTALAQLAAGRGLTTSSFTLFGGFESCELPSEDKELNDLALQRQLGQIPEPAVNSLMLAIGQGGPQRFAAVRNAVNSTFAARG